MPSVIVSKVNPLVSTEKIKELFSFCGAIENVTQLAPDQFEVLFQLTKALETALLLNEAELEDSVISVSTKDSFPEKDTLALSLGAQAYPENEDINQEEKPKLAVLAQLLASGYKISDSLIEKAIAFDKEKGLSQSFLAFINDLDAKYIHTQDPESTALKNMEKANAALGDITSRLNTFANLRDVQNYLDKAAASSSGLKIHQFYKNVTQEIMEVHQEANRLYLLQKEQEKRRAEAALHPTDEKK